MSTIRNPLVAVIAGCAVFAAVFASLSNRPASAQQAAETKPEYSVTTVDANALPAKVTELAGQGWDVVTITVLEARVDGNNNPPKVITEKYDVTCRRMVKR